MTDNEKDRKCDHCHERATFIRSIPTSGYNSGSVWELALCEEHSAKHDVATIAGAVPTTWLDSLLTGPEGLGYNVENTYGQYSDIVWRTKLGGKILAERVTTSDALVLVNLANNASVLQQRLDKAEQVKGTAITCGCSIVDGVLTKCGSPECFFGSATGAAQQDDENRNESEGDTQDVVRSTDWLERQLKDYFDTWGPHSGAPRSVFEGHWRALLADIFDNIEERAEAAMVKTHKLEGMHYAALSAVRRELKLRSRSNDGGERPCDWTRKQKEVLQYDDPSHHQIH